MGTPILNYMRDVMEKGALPLEGASNGSIIEEAWLCEMLFLLEAKYKYGGIF